MRYFLILIFIFCLVIFYKGLKKDPLIPSNLLSKEIPEFSISSFSGSTLKTSDLRDNKVKLLTFLHHGALLVKLNIISF